MNDMNDIYENIAEYNPNKKCKRLIMCDNMVDDMLSSEKLQQIAINHSTDIDFKAVILLSFCIRINFGN